MPTFKFNKLVRDKIVEHQIASGAQPHYRQLDASQHRKELVKKIIEEAQEILSAAQEEVAAEIADVRQAIDDLTEAYSLSDATIRAIQQAKRDKNGPFKKGIFIESVDVDEHDEWVSYYRKHPDRYPEIK
jgi:predicted house-cleaning noncanonical NTP pyrophosphatase (MazG superfamily)